MTDLKTSAELRAMAGALQRESYTSERPSPIVTILRHLAAMEEIVVDLPPPSPPGTFASALTAPELRDRLEKATTAYCAVRAECDALRAALIRVVEADDFRDGRERVTSRMSDAIHSARLLLENAARPRAAVR